MTSKLEAVHVISEDGETMTSLYSDTLPPVGDVIDAPRASDVEFRQWGWCGREKLLQAGWVVRLSDHELNREFKQCVVISETEAVPPFDINPKTFKGFASREEAIRVERAFLHNVILGVPGCS